MHISIKRRKERAKQYREQDFLDQLKNEKPVSQHIEYDEDGDPLYIMKYADGREVTSTFPFYE